MLDRRVVRWARRLVPEWLQDQINPLDGVFRRAVESLSAALPKGAWVLDAGAGEAQYKPIFTKAGQRYVAIDLGIGEPDWSYSDIDVLANTEQPPFRPGAFDGVLSVAVLEHSPRPRQVVHELNAVLREGGHLMIVVPTMWEEHQMPNDFYRFTRYGISRLLEEAGFEIQQQYPIGGYFWFMGRKSIDILEFFQKMPRLIFWPVLAVPFGLVVPVICRHLDWLDKEKFYTIGQICLAKKVRSASSYEGPVDLP